MASFEEWFEENKHLRNIAGVRRSISNQYGRGWGDDEFVAWMHDKYDREQEAIQIAEKLASRPPYMDAPPGTGVEERLEHYLQYYEEPAPNDLILLRQMARIEVALDDIAEKQMQALEDGNRAGAKGYSDMFKSLTGEHRSIQKELGIDRVRREHGKAKADLATYVQEIIQRTSEFMEEHTIPIRCPHCKNAPGKTEIDMGFILFHFRQDTSWGFECKCPLCGEAFRLP